jgi:hypothetical protein
MPTKSNKYDGIDLLLSVYSLHSTVNKLFSFVAQAMVLEFCDYPLKTG